MSIFAEVGGSIQQIGGNCPEGWIVMQGERPTPEHVATAEGTWFLNDYETARVAANTEARAYLASTDWYVTRLQETGQPVPEEVLVSRAAAREKVVHPPVTPP